MASKSTSKRSLARAFTVGVLLQKLNRGQHPQSIATDLNKSKQLINYYLRLLEKWGYITRKIRSNIVIYDLLPKGKEFIERHDSVFERGVLPRFHRYAHRHVVLGGFEGLERFLPLSSGTKLGALRGGVIAVDGSFESGGERFSVRRWHSPSQEQLFMYIPATYSSSIGDALVSAGIKLDRLAHAIQERFSIQLGEYEKLQGAEWAFEKDPFARYWHEISAGGVIKTQDGTIDASEGDPEVEFFTTEAATAYLNMPQQVQEQGRAIGEIKQTFEQVAKDFRETTADYKETTVQFGKEMNSHLSLIHSLEKTTEVMQETTRQMGASMKQIGESVGQIGNAVQDAVKEMKEMREHGSWISRLLKR